MGKLSSEQQLFLNSGKGESKMKKGYSLLELLVVLSIIALILVITTVSLGQAYRKLSREAQLTAVVEKVFYAICEARRRGAVDDYIVMIKYEDRTFQVFKDNDLDGQPDGDTFPILSVGIPSNIAVKLNETDVERVGDWYSMDAAFFTLRTKEEGQQTLRFLTIHSNLDISFSIDKVSRTIRIRNSLPTILD